MNISQRVSIAGLVGVSAISISIIHSNQSSAPQGENPTIITGTVATGTITTQQTDNSDQKRIDELLTLIDQYEKKLKQCAPKFIAKTQEFRTQVPGESVYEFDKEPCEWYGKAIDHGKSITAYQKGARIDGKFVCEEEERFCIDGVLDGTFELQQCNHPGNGPHRCPSPIGAIDHGKSVTLFQNNIVSYPEECTSISRTCRFGTLEGDNAYDQPSCKQAGEVCALPRGGTIGHNTTITAYSKDSVPYGSECAVYAQQRTCINGTLQGGAKYKFSVCENAQPKGCTVPGGTLAHSQTLTLYKLKEVPGTVETAGKDICPRQSRTCDNGTLKTLEGGPAGFTYTFKSCTVVPPGDNITQ